jgi:uncharacterized membrane protein YdjX (TVP38/TMEM64 family)
MIGFIIDQILGPFWPWIAAAFGGLFLFLTGRSSGAAKAKAKQDKETIKSHEVRNEVEADVAREPHARKRLHDDWAE